jgi:hypothetical protein
MSTNLRIATIAAILATGLGYASVAFSGKPPPPPPSYNPQISYTVGTQRATTIYVANADGTDAVSVYSTGNIIWNLKPAPGHRIVFIEQNDIKVLTYAVSSQGVTTTSVTTLSSEPYHVLRVDASPDGTELVFVEDTATPDQEAIYAMNMSGVKTLINLPPALYVDAVWAHSNSRIAVLQDGPVVAGSHSQTIQAIDLDASYNIINTMTVFDSLASQMNQIPQIESAHTSDTLIFNATSASTLGVYTLDIGTQAISLPIVTGGSPSLSSDDSTILFIGPTGVQFYEFNRNTQTQTPVSTPKGARRPDFLQ